MVSEGQQPDVQFDVTLPDGEDWGVRLSEGLQIMGIRSGGPFDGKCIIGDQIIEVNNAPVKNIDEFERVIQETGPVLQIQVTRGATKSELKLLPPEREKNIHRRDGFSYHLAQIDYQKGCKFGLGIKHFQNKVLVSRVDEGSLSAKALALGDRIVDINGVPVTDKDVARTLLLKSLQKTHTVSLAIERAEAEEAKDMINKALNASEMQPPSFAMASDIRDIVQRQKQKMERPEHKKKKPGIMRTASSAQERKVIITDGRKSIVIATDHEGKNLKHIGPGHK